MQSYGTQVPGKRLPGLVLGKAIKDICFGEEPKVIAVKRVDRRAPQVVPIDEGGPGLTRPICQSHHYLRLGSILRRKGSYLLFDGSGTCTTQDEPKRSPITLH